MKKILVTFLLPVAIFAQSFLISNIPVPKTYVLNLDPYPCDEACLQEYVDKDMIFSFLAHANTKLENPHLNEIRNMNVGILNIGSTIINTKLRIALLLPYKRIGKYASSTTNASFAYLIAKNQPFELKSYKIENENQEDIQAALTNIIDDGFNYIIAPLTTEGSDILSTLDPQINIFLPTINKKDSTSTSPYLYFGGIDYRAQSDLLLKEAVSPLVIFYDESSIGQKLASYEEDTFCYQPNQDINATKIRLEDREAIKYSISRKTTNLEHYLKDNQDINGSTCIINTPIVKTSMVMSQLTLFDTNATNILSTQINYDPLILSMTQYIDRQKMLIANSITEHKNVFIETNAILSNDIEYDWINYATTIAVDYFFHLITNEDREYNLALQENQVLYPIEMLKPSISRFIKYTPLPKLEETEY
ncbi:MAG: hypothetical protein H8E76_08705 [Helicobacteraceae bacterium]|nr:hypothetical protein [Candidatus Sulfurimonas ponti]MBL6974065.1 hypothetical protein [Sulfurimonas sp.]